MSHPVLPELPGTNHQPDSTQYVLLNKNFYNHSYHRTTNTAPDLTPQL